MARMFDRFRLTRHEKACAAKFAGNCPAKPWDHIYRELPLTLMEMAARDEPKAAYVLGDMFDQGMGGIDRDLQKAHLYYRFGEEIGDPDAINNLGSMHFQGDGLPLDHALARQYFERAVAGGCAAAMNNLGRMHLDGDGGAEVDVEKGLSLLMRGAEAFDIDAALKLQSIYLQGLYGQPRDRFQRVRWLWQAAHNGSANAYAIIGVILDDGELVTAQPERARQLYEMALERGSGYGAYCLA